MGEFVLFVFFCSRFSETYCRYFFSAKIGGAGR